MTRWLGRLGAALIATVVITFTVWLISALVIWLDSAVPAPVMALVAVAIFVIVVVGDVIYDMIQNPADVGARYDRARREALARGDDQL